MRLLTREGVRDEFHIPLAAIDERLKILGVSPFIPPRRGRGHCMLYDADEIVAALRAERERQSGKPKKQLISNQRKDGGPMKVFSGGWKAARQLLEANCGACN